jgi:hypothetical protein
VINLDGGGALVERDRRVGAGIVEVPDKTVHPPDVTSVTSTELRVCLGGGPQEDPHRGGLRVERNPNV